MRAAPAHGHRMDAGWTSWAAERATRSVRAANAKDGGRFWSTVPMVMGDAEPWVPRKPTAGRPSGRLGGHAGIRSMSGPVAAAPSLRRARPRAARTCAERSHAGRLATAVQGCRVRWSAWPWRA